MVSGGNRNGKEMVASMHEWNPSLIVHRTAPRPNRGRARAWAGLVAAAVIATCGAGRLHARGPGSPEPELKYVKKATREETRQATLAQYLPEGLEYGPWWLAGPFPYAGDGHIGDPLLPERGFDPVAVYVGKNGVEVRWQETTYRDGEMMDLRVFGQGANDNAANEYAAAYLYREIRIGEPHTLEVDMGQDDGLRVWLNGRLILDNDGPHSWTPDENRVRLDLEPGVNRLLVKVGNMSVGWNCSFTEANVLDPMLEAMLDYRLDLDFPESPEDRYYRMLTVPLPDDVVLEVGGLEVLENGGRVAVATRRGEVWIIDGAYDDPPFAARFTRFASGLHEPLGLQSREGALYTVQRSELTRLIDEDGDDAADLYETFCNRWGVSGNYHEFAFGPKFDREGNAWVTLNVGFCGSLGKSLVPWRGWAVKITPEGELQPVCGGLRSPNGIGMNAAGDMFYTDNQGDWVGTNKLSHLEPGDFHGHPSTRRWYDAPDAPGGDAPGTDPGIPYGYPANFVPMHVAVEHMPSLKLPAVWFPYPDMGQSASDILCDTTGGKFGPFEGQLFVGDQMNVCVNRVFLEKVDGEYQGACFPFRTGFDCGVNRQCWGKDGSMFVGMTNRGWGSLGRKPYGLQRLVWTGLTPFEVREMKARPDGFDLIFTRPLDAASAGNPGSYRMKSYTYLYHEPYGSPEIDTAELKIAGALVSADGLKVTLTVENLRVGYVHELTMPGVRDAQDGESLLHAEAYYTLNRIPKDVQAHASETKIAP